MSWCPLRLCERPLSNLRGGVKRQDKMDVNLFSRDDDFIEQALRDGLPFFKRELVQMIPQ